MSFVPSALRNGSLFTHFFVTALRGNAETTDGKLLPACRNNPDLSGLLHVVEFRHAAADVAPLHGIRAKAQCSLVGGQRFFIP